jgi:hypothetical protein
MWASAMVANQGGRLATKKRRGERRREDMKAKPSHVAQAETEKDSLFLCLAEEQSQALQIGHEICGLTSCVQVLQLQNL